MALLTQAQVFALFKSVEAFDDTKPFANYTAAEAYFSDRLGFAVPRSSLAAACKTTGKKVVRRMAQKAKGNSDLVKAIADVHGRVDALTKQVDDRIADLIVAYRQFNDRFDRHVENERAAATESLRNIGKDFAKTNGQLGQLEHRVAVLAKNLEHVAEAVAYNSKSLKLTVERQTSFDISLNAIRDKVQRLEAMPHNQWRPVSNEELTT